MLFDSEFVIAMSRGRGSVARARVEAFLAGHKPLSLYVSRVTVAEVYEGFESKADGDASLARFAPLEIDAEIAWLASRIARELKGGGRHIGDNDIWIAATALAYGQPLVTNNGRHFARVSGLHVIGY